MAYLPDLSPFIKFGSLEPEFRRDPLNGEWVVFAPQRACKPDPLGNTGAQRSCPFCAGNEEETLSEVLAFRPSDSKPNDSKWRVRVIPNLYPAVSSDLGRGRIDSERTTRPGFGIHEVVIEGPDHHFSWIRLSTEVIQEVFLAWRDRLKTLGRTPGIEYVKIFKNHGRDAGASLEHNHSQIVALPLIPNRIQRELNALRLDPDVISRLLEDQRHDGPLMIANNPRITAIASPSARWPFECWLFPKDLHPSFSSVDLETTEDLAKILHRILHRLEELIPGLAYNLALHTAPTLNAKWESFRWRLELYPRLTMPAGFEWGTGMHINPILPEVAAKLLRLQ
jgi:UDPglucose--hexose-1-phosphate uridylyltransferase